MNQAHVTLSLLLLLLYALYLCVQSWAIVGIYLAAEGKTEKLPDGTDKDSDNLLYPLYKWLHQTKKVRRIYKERQLEDLIDKLKRAGLWPEGEFSMHYGQIQFTDGKDHAQFLALAPLIDRQFDVQLSPVSKYGVLYKCYDEYRFSKYVRKPTLGCPTCMASLWSVLTYAVPMYHLFGWQRWWLWLWPVTVCALAYLNTYHTKRVK
jgi:hypothetical protein